MNNDKLDELLSLTREIHHSVTEQETAIVNLRKEMGSLRELIDQMEKRNRKQALLAGGLSGGIAAIGFELIRMKLGG